MSLGNTVVKLCGTLWPPRGKRGGLTADEWALVIDEAERLRTTVSDEQVTACLTELRKHNEWPSVKALCAALRGLRGKCPTAVRERHDEAPRLAGLRKRLAAAGIEGVEGWPPHTVIETHWRRAMDWIVGECGEVPPDYREEAQADWAVFGNTGNPNWANAGADAREQRYKGERIGYAAWRANGRKPTQPRLRTAYTPTPSKAEVVAGLGGDTGATT